MSISRDYGRVARGLLDDGITSRWIRVTVDGLTVELEVTLLKLTDKQTGESETHNEARGHYGAPAGVPVH